MPPRTKSRAAKSAQATHSRFANVNGTRLHYLAAGEGDPVVLLHGYAETSHMWLPLIAELAPTHTIIAPDLRGAGQSSTPADGYTKAAMAQDIHALVRKLGFERIQIVGHDIGLMVAYAYAAQYPDEVDRIALMDAFLPGVGNWRDTGRKWFRPLRSNPLVNAHACLTGEKASGDFLIQQGRLVATNVEGVVVRNSGHWLMEEAPNQVISKLVEFLTR
jgi:pimeloyl-ACP methyl ester carboxylesterase